jgi:dTMP kinase
MQRGKFITVEGIEGVGKSTNLEFIVQLVKGQGHDVVESREPGGTPMAEDIRKLLLDHGDEPLPDIAELLLMFSSRALLVENVIRPALSAGTWVVCDRFVDASRAYQGGGRGIPLDDINQIASWVLGDLKPDLTILLDAPVATSRRRADARSAPDRIEVEREEFFGRVRDCYLQLALAEPHRFVVIDATQDRADVRVEVESATHALFSDKTD